MLPRVNISSFGSEGIVLLMRLALVRYAVEFRRVCLALGAMALLPGCAHLGPKTITADRFDYSTAISDSWKQQTLLNIVKLRYMDLPVFVDVASIVSGYSMQTGVSVNGTLSSQRAIQGNYLAAGGQAIYTDRPTITYVPMTGQKFLRGLVTPIDPKNIFFLIQAGYAADFVLGLTVESINGVRNRSTAGGRLREADPEFIRALELLREVQAGGAVGMRVEEDKSKATTALLFFKRDDVPADILEKAAEIRRLLKLAPNQQKFVLAYSPVRGTENELTVNSRSMLQIMAAFSSYLDVPEAHLKDHSAVPGSEILPWRTGKAPCGFTPARTSRATPSRPCVTAITGSGLTRATGKQNAPLPQSCFSSL